MALKAADRGVSTVFEPLIEDNDLAGLTTIGDERMQ